MQAFENYILQTYGERGKVWLEKIPEMIDELAKKYHLTNLKPVPNLNFNYVAAGYQTVTYQTITSQSDKHHQAQDKPIILKMGLNTKAFRKEALCLKAFKGLGAVEVLTATVETDTAENETAVLILECAVPGKTLKSYFPDKEEESIEITTAIIKKLHTAQIPKNHHYYSVKELLQTLDQNLNSTQNLNIPEKFLNKARQLRDALLVSTTKLVLLHGDLHHENILQNDQEWRVIDPKGFIGDPVYEVVAFIRNPIPDLLQHPEAQKIIRHRVRRFAELLNLSESRINDWCFVQAVLSWVWALEDNTKDVSYFQDLTELLAS